MATKQPPNVDVITKDGQLNQLWVRWLQEVSALASGGTAGSKIVRNWGPTQASFPTTNYATLDTRNTHPILDYDDTTQETAYFHGIFPDNYAGEGVTIEVWWSAIATSGNISWEVALENMDNEGLDIDGDSWATTATIAGAAVPSTSGFIKSTSVDIADGSDMASLVAGDLFRLRVQRDPDTGSDATGDVELHFVEMRIQ